jgi:hypothetical protein
LILSISVSVRLAQRDGPLFHVLPNRRAADPDPAGRLGLVPIAFIRIAAAKEKADKVLVVYGGKFCYVNADAPTRTMQKIIAEQGPNVARIDATHCMDMIASEAEREEIAREVAGGEKVWWMTPGWVQFRHKVFKGWDKGLANENFPRHTGGAIVLDGIGFMDRYMAEWPEAFLEYADWMGIPMTPYTVSLDRFTSLLTDQARRLSSA